MNLAVIERCAQGIARALVIQALEVGLTQAAMCAVLELRASNHGRACTLPNLGFRDVTTRPTTIPIP